MGESFAAVRIWTHIGLLSTVDPLVFLQMVLVLEILSTFVAFKVPYTRCMRLHVSLKTMYIYECFPTLRTDLL